MIKTMKYVSGAIALALVLATAAFAQQPATNTPAPTDNYVTEKNFKSRIFEVKYRDPNSLASAIKQLGSGFKGAAISSSSEFKTITVRDFPENLVRSRKRSSGWTRRPRRGRTSSCICTP